MTMLVKSWHIDEVHWGSSSRPTHITVRLDDPALYPAVEQFAQDEGLKAIPSETGQRNERWIAYPRPDFELAKARLDRYVANLYWEHRWAAESQYKIGDEVEIVEVLNFRPGQQPIFVQIYDTGTIEKIVGSDLYVVSFKNSGVITHVPGKSLGLL